MNASSTAPDGLPDKWIDRLRSQEGFGLVETLTAAIMVTILAAGTFTAVQSMTKAGAQERTRATGHAVAQADQSRMRNMKIDQLANYSETRTVTDGGTEFEVKSSAQYVSDATGTASCGTDDASADYIRISSSVEWPSIGTRPAVLLQSTISPPNGSISPNAGALAVRVEDAVGQRPRGDRGVRDRRNPLQRRDERARLRDLRQPDVGQLPAAGKHRRAGRPRRQPAGREDDQRDPLRDQRGRASVRPAGRDRRRLHDQPDRHAAALERRFGRRLQHRYVGGEDRGDDRQPRRRT